MLAAEHHWAGVRYASGVKLGYEKWGTFKHQAAFLLLLVLFTFITQKLREFPFLELILGLSK